MGNEPKSQAEHQVLERGDDEKQGTTEDRVNMLRMGKIQELRRNFRFFSIFGFSMILMSSWEACLSLSTIGLINGGTAGLIWISLLSWIGFILINVSMAEMGSMAPTTSGQYHWVSEFAPRKHQKFLSYLMGWLCVLGWQTSCAATAYLSGTQIQGLVVLNYPEYAPKQWHGTLVTIAVAAFAVFFNTALARRLPIIQAAVLIVHLFGFIGVLVTLWALSPRADAKAVFTEFSDGGGWGSLGGSTLMGITAGVLPLLGADAAVHMAEEVRDAAKVIPRSMIATTIFNGALGWVMVITYCFCLGDLNDILSSPTGYPYMQVFYNTTQSIGGASMMAVIIIFIAIFSNLTIVATASRQLYAFARDEGLPFSSWFANVRPGWDLPLNAVFTTFVASSLLSLINIGSPVALNSITSLATTSLLSSYMCSIGCMVWRRWTKNPLLPSKLELGKWGLAINIASEVFLVVFFVLSFFPVTPSPSAAGMNWNILIYGVVVVFSLVYYFFSGRHRYVGPVDNMSVSKSAAEQWKWRLSTGDWSPTLDKLMYMIGLEEVKQKFLDVKNKVRILSYEGVDIKMERFNAVFLGNPGTGKTTVAKLYSELLQELNVFGLGQNWVYKETSGSLLASEGVTKVKEMLEEMLQNGGGALFIDETYQLVNGNNGGGTAVLDYLLSEMEQLRGKIVFIFAGYKSQMEKVYSHNPGLPSRLPWTFKFEDYTDKELQQILEAKIRQKFKNGMGIEQYAGKLDEPNFFCRLVAQRIGQGRSRDGFANAREVENTLDKICERRAQRYALFEQDYAQNPHLYTQKPGPPTLTQYDILGPADTIKLDDIPAWRELSSMIGLTKVKQSIETLVNLIQDNFRLELQDRPTLRCNLNTMFLGPPGTGKTTVATLYGKILAHLGLLSNGEVIEKRPTDFIGDAVGVSETKTKSILESAKGKVLIIDEAYQFAASDGPERRDPYKSSIVDTLVAEVRGDVVEDRCVILLGYKKKMEDMIRDGNEGLARRFPLESAFVFEDYTRDEIQQIWRMKLKKNGMSCSDEAEEIAMDVIDRQRQKLDFANAGAVDNLINYAQKRYTARMEFSSSAEKNGPVNLEPADIDPFFDRVKNPKVNVRKLFSGVVGLESIIKKLEDWQELALKLKELKKSMPDGFMDVRDSVPYVILFKGPPGTGKTSTARKMGVVYESLGVLASADVVEVSAKDLIGSYIGHTVKKTRKVIESALGKVLFIDEAYLLGESSFGKEVVDEINTCLTLPQFKSKMIVILAGYNEGIDRLMSLQPGMQSRFTEVFNFADLSPATSAELLHKLLASSSYDASEIKPWRENVPNWIQLLEHMRELVARSGWGNARDVETLCASIRTQTILKSDTSVLPLKVALETVLEQIDSMKKARPISISQAVKSYMQEGAREQDLDMAPFETKTASAPTQRTREANGKNSTVSRDKKRSIATKLGYERVSKKQKYRFNQSFVPQAAPQQINEKRTSHSARAVARIMYEKKKRVQEDRKKTPEPEPQPQPSNKVQQESQEETKQKELAKQQKKLQQLQPCVAGFQWDKVDAGWRCQGGSHYLSDAEASRLLDGS
ncbi:putative Amino acid transporter [Seiridium cardinale]|uniref:Amino acid transporter n=1 Tax=Seiridium cardinale TaxID=138064 RepID=A0ABR2Y2Z0_9PEZI